MLREAAREPARAPSSAATTPARAGRPRRGDAPARRCSVWRLVRRHRAARLGAGRRGPNAELGAARGLDHRAGAGAGARAPSRRWPRCDDGDERLAARAGQTLGEDLQRAAARARRARPAGVQAEPNDHGLAVQRRLAPAPALAERSRPPDSSPRSCRRARRCSSARERDAAREPPAGRDRAPRSSVCCSAADRHAQSVNAELQKRPTSTGVRFRLLWQPARRRRRRAGRLRRGARAAC
ncbi:MAG: hypothetical protein MZW92_66920 [Comamonadaceae bacterium]|nr:hypothetical protein [Comamonadaceae bacterium]